MEEMLRLSAGNDPDCFIELGSYQVCDATHTMSITSSLFLLYFQALISRILTPGKSSFVSASVRLVLLALTLLQTTHVSQILASTSSDFFDESFGIETTNEEDSSRPHDLQ
jgi:hypothetical protein